MRDVVSARVLILVCASLSFVGCVSTPQGWAKSLNVQVHQQEVVSVQKGVETEAARAALADSFVEYLRKEQACAVYAPAKLHLAWGSEFYNPPYSWHPLRIRDAARSFSERDYKLIKSDFNDAHSMAHFIFRGEDPSNGDPCYCLLVMKVGAQPSVKKVKASIDNGPQLTYYGLNGASIRFTWNRKSVESAWRGIFDWWTANVMCTGFYLADMVEGTAAFRPGNGNESMIYAGAEESQKAVEKLCSHLMSSFPAKNPSKEK